MNEKKEISLEVAPGVLKASWVRDAGRPPGLSLEVSLWTPSTQQEIIHRFGESPAEVYSLLRGKAPEWFTSLEIFAGETLSPSDTNGEMAAQELLDQVKEALMEQPLLVLKLKGLPKEELIDTVLTHWSRVVTDTQAGSGTGNPAEKLAAELTRLERKGPAVASGEWLAEAAAEGSLHQPGSLFHEVADRPFPSKPVIAEATEDWRPLLPQTPKVQEGLAHITHRVAEAAARRAQLRNHP